MTMYDCKKIFLTLTYKCNAWCEKCATRRSIRVNKQMSKETLDLIFGQLNKYNFKGELLIAAGETLLYPYLEYFIKEVLAINNKISLTIFTNGKLFLPSLSNVYFNPRIQWLISLDGFYQNDLNKLQYNLDINSVKNNIQQIAKLNVKPRFSLNYTLNNRNIENLLNYLNFCLAVKPERIYITKLKVFKEFFEKLKDYDLNFNDSYVSDIFIKAKRFCKTHNLQVEFPISKQEIKSECWNKGCLSPVIDYNGDISFCNGREDAPISNIFCDDHVDKWNKILENLKSNKTKNIWCTKCYSNNNSICK